MAIDLNKIVNIVSSLTGGNSKAMDAVKQAISESNNYAPTLQGALQIAQKFGFNAASIANMKQHLNNPMVQMGINMIAPGSIDQLNNMGNQLEQALNQNTKSVSTNTDDISTRLAKLGIR